MARVSERRPAMADQPLSRLSKPTHVCVDCGELGYAGGYHDHGDGNAGETIALSALPLVIQSFQRIENERDDLRVEVERLTSWIDTEGRDCPSNSTVVDAVLEGLVDA
jgi:hypothetical protein